MRSRSSFITVAAAALALMGLGPVAAQAQDVAEPRSGVRFPAKADGMTLLGTGLRTRTMLKVKVYAIGLYAGDDALRGPLAAFKGTPAGRELYTQLVWGDFPRQVTMKFVRDVTRDQIQGAFREVLPAGPRLEAFVNYFGDTRSGQEYVLRWVPGRGLMTTVAGQEKAVIDDKEFAAAVFGIWLGDKPIQDDIKRDLVARLPQVAG
jgi:hypothetical protein